MPRRDRKSNIPRPSSNLPLAVEPRRSTTSEWQQISATSEPGLYINGCNPTDEVCSQPIRFARKVVAKTGVVEDAEVVPVRDADIVAHVALNGFTNYSNKLASTAIHLPKATALPAGASTAAGSEGFPCGNIRAT